MDFQLLFDTFSQCFGSTQVAYPTRNERESGRRFRSHSTRRNNSNFEGRNFESPFTPSPDRQDRNSSISSSTQRKARESSSRRSRTIIPPRPPPEDDHAAQEGPKASCTSNLDSTVKQGSQREISLESGGAKQRTAVQPPRCSIRSRSESGVTTRKQSHNQEIARPKSGADDNGSANPRHVRQSSEAISRERSARSRYPLMTKDDIFRLHNRRKSSAGSFGQSQNVVENALCFGSKQVAEPVASAPRNDEQEPERVPTVDTAEVSLPASMFFERTASQLQQEELMPLYNQFSVPINASEQDGLSDVLATRSEINSRFDGTKPEQKYSKKIFVAAGGHDYFPEQENTKNSSTVEAHAADPTNTHKLKGLTPQRKRTESTMSLSNASGMSMSSPGNRRSLSSPGNRRGMASPGNRPGIITLVPHNVD